ncbi:reprolysin-like metallopeptidase [Winogradskyella sp.]|uniref:zinc-dependent metalloprotease n=1 Tax=Winogradskyella sp. TaxID=1883156 RepID=UPI0025DD770B|nr:zinc-dependent metalloprotease family protein [Winogradskyella sp.]
MNKTVHTFISLLFLLSGLTGFSQTNPWIQKNPISVENKTGFENLKTEQHKFYSLNQNLLIESLINVPQRGVNDNLTTIKISFPNENGDSEVFSIFEASVLATSLSQKYPNIKSYVGYSESGSILRFSLDHRGLQATIMSNKKTSTYIQFLDRNTNNHVVYSADARNDELNDFVCSTPNEYNEVDNTNFQNRDANDQLLRTYRMAVSTTGEYAQFHGGTIADALAAINATITRVNMVFETDLAVTFEIQDFDQLIYTDATTDPFADSIIGSDGNNFGTLDSWGAQLQNLLTTEIGNAAYDIGHLFATNTAINGNAGCIGCVCNDDDGTSDTDNDKGAAYTSSENPIGEYFDLVTTHEIGHQMGANHTWSFAEETGTITNSEPGSGSTIMGYAGITGDNNVQLEPDPYFHYHSIRQISDNFNFNNTCWITNNPITIVNNAPIANAGNNYTIPQGTAYVLKGNATDADTGDNLFYCWEGIDNGRVTNTDFGPNYISGSMVRSLPPNPSSNRYVPNLGRVAANQLTETNPTLGSAWETVSIVNRTLNYALTVRDREPDALGLNGQSSYDTMQVTVDQNSGPFVVTSQTTTETWLVGTNQDITWDVAGTDTGSVNTPNVNILLSIDGGQTFPFTLASDIPNSGNANIAVPDIGDVDTSTARLIVEGNNNIFFAMNASDFEILNTDFIIKSDYSDNAICSGDDAAYDFTYLTYLGFNDLTTFSGSNLPPGTSLIFNPTSAITNGTQVTALLTDTENLSNGFYSFDLVATSGSESFSETVYLTVYDEGLVIPTLLSPLDNAIISEFIINFSWDSNSNTESYYLEVSEDDTFSSVVISEFIETNSYAAELEPGTEYFWRVTPENLCETGFTSNEFSFITGSCTEYDATDLPIEIPESGVSNPYNSVITITEDLVIQDINIGITIDHTWNEDLDILLIAPNGTQIELSIGNGGSEDNYTNTIFDQEATEPITSGTPPFTGSFIPEGDLSLLYGLSSMGDWTLNVSDNFSGADGGTILNFTVDICSATTLSTETFQNENMLSIYPNPANGNFTISSTIPMDDTKINIYDANGRSVLKTMHKTYGSFLHKEISVNHFSAGIYFVEVSDGLRKVVKKLIIN